MQSTHPTVSKFPLGQIVATPAALELLEAHNVSPQSLLERHESGDWGVLCSEDHESNEQALKYGDRLFSSYPMGDNEKVWIITEYDRSVTTILLPDDY